MKKRLIIIIVIGIFLLIPLVIDKFVLNKFVTNWDIKDWAGFLGSYLGGGISGIITLFGVWWQITNEKKEKEKENKLGLLKYVEYILAKNLYPDISQKDNILEKNTDFLMRTYHVLSYDSICLTGSETTDMLIKFNSKIIDDNFNYIFLCSFGNELYELQDKIEKFNKVYDFLLKNLNEKRAFVRKLEEYFNEEKRDAINLLKDLSSLIRQISFNKAKLEIVKEELNKVYEILEKSEKARDSMNANLEEMLEKNNYKDIMKLLGESLIKVLLFIQKGIKENNELNQQLLEFMREDDKICRLDVFKIFEDMDKLLKEIKNEIRRLESK